MKIENSGYYLKLWLNKQQIDKIPTSFRNSTYVDADFMLLANNREVTLIESLISDSGEIIPERDYDWILVYEENTKEGHNYSRAEWNEILKNSKLENNFIPKETLLKAIQRMEDYPCCMSCYLKYEEVVAARDVRDTMIRILKEEVGL